MVIIGGTWGPRRRRGYGPYGPGPGYGYRGGSSCGRDLCLIESGCCLAEMIGCGPQLGLLGPLYLVRTARTSWRETAHDPSGGPRVGHAGGRPTRLVLAAIRAYQRDISPRRGPCCRYSPTCSTYAARAVEVHGLCRGGLLAVRRLLRCRPGSVGGDDPVPAVAACG